MAELFKTSLFNDANLQHYYRFEGNSNDSKGAINGTDTNMSYILAKYGKGANFSGTGVITLSAAIASGTGDYSIGCWVNSTNSSLDNTILTQHNDSSSGIWTFRMTAGKMNFWDYNGSSFQFSTAATSSTSVNDGAWHLVVFTRTGTSGTYYTDGKPDGTTTAASNLSWNTQAAKIGEDSVGSTFFTGTMDDLFIFNRVLTPQEIKTLYLPQGGLIGDI